MPDAFFERSRKQYPASDIGALRLFLAIRTAARRIDNVAGIWLDRYRMTVTKFDVLQLLASAQPEGTTISDLRDNLRMTQPNVTFVVNNLERERLVRRTQSPVDGRSRILSITKKGLACLDELTPGQLGAIGKALKHVSDHERSLLIALLADIANAFEQVDAP